MYGSALTTFSKERYPQRTREQDAGGHVETYRVEGVHGHSVVAEERLFAGLTATVPARAKHTARRLPHLRRRRPPRRVWPDSAPRSWRQRPAARAGPLAH